LPGSRRGCRWFRINQVTIKCRVACAAQMIIASFTKADGALNIFVPASGILTAVANDDALS
jgi:hypothetical protein